MTIIYYIVDKKIYNFKISDFAITIVVTIYGSLFTCTWVIRFVYICVCIRVFIFCSLSAVFALSALFISALTKPEISAPPISFVAHSIYVYISVPRLSSPFICSMTRSVYLCHLYLICSVYIFCDFSAIYTLSILSAFSIDMFFISFL